MGIINTMSTEKTETPVNTETPDTTIQQDSGEDLKTYQARVDLQIAGLIEENKKIVAFNNIMKEEKRLDAEKARNAILNAETKTKEEADNVIKQYKQELADRDAKLTQIEQERRINKLSDTAKDLTRNITVDPNRADVFARLLKERIRLAPDGTVQVLDKQGNLTISSVDVLLNTLKNEYPFLVDAVKSTGGGGHNNAGTATKSFKEMNSDEKVEFWHRDQAGYLAAEAASKIK